MTKRLTNKDLKRLQATIGENYGATDLTRIKIAYDNDLDSFFIGTLINCVTVNTKENGETEAFIDVNPTVFSIMQGLVEVCKGREEIKG